MTPKSFCGRYQSDVLRVKKNPMLIHHLGILQPLNKHDVKEHFWINMFGGKNSSLITHLSRMNYDGFFPYVFYSVKPKLVIHIKSEVIEKILGNNYQALKVEARLFPFGIAVIHLKFYTKAALTVKDTILLERMLRNNQIFGLTANSAKKLGLQADKNYNLQTLFEKIAERLRETIYLGQRQPVDNYPPDFHVIRFGKSVQDVSLDDKTVAQLMVLKDEPAYREIVRYKEQRLKPEDLLEINDALAFGNGSTLLYMSKGDPAHKACFRRNYSNVVEFALVRHYVLQTFYRYIVNEWDRTISQVPHLGKLDGYTIDAIDTGLKQYNGCLKGGHGKFYKLIHETRDYKDLEVRFKKMSFDEFWAGREIFKQLEVTQKTLKTIGDNLENDKTSAGILLSTTQDAVNALYVKGKSIEDGLNNTLQTLNDVRNDPVGANQQTILQLKNVISNYRREYEDHYYSRFIKVTEELANPDKVEKVANQKRQEGANVPSKEKVDELIKTAKTELEQTKQEKAKVAETDKGSFIVKALPYIEGIAKVATTIFKAIGWLPV